jgi:hypothetical protein
MSIQSLSQNYKIPETSYRALKEAIEKLSTKAVKLGFPPFEIRVDRTEEKEYKEGCVKKWLYITITGERAVISGFEFIGSIQHLQNSKDNIVKSIPGENIPSKFRSRRECDRCKHDRYRKDTFIIRELKTQSYFQIGRNCLKDFFEGYDPHVIASYVELLGILEQFIKCSEEEITSSSNPEYLKLEYYLWFVAYSIRNHGWVSKSSAYNSGKQSTAQAALNYLLDHSSEVNKLGLAESDRRIAHEAILWAKSLSERPEEELNNYLYNIKVIAETGVVDSKLFGYAASIIPAWGKETGNGIDGKEKNRSQVSESQHFGLENEKSQWPLYLESVTECQGPYISWLHHFTDPQGRVAKWFSTNSPHSDQRYYMVKGRIKKHDEFRGQKQTILTRCSCEEILDEMKIQSLFKDKVISKEPEQPPKEMEAELVAEQPKTTDNKKEPEQVKGKDSTYIKPDPNITIDQRLKSKFSFITSGGR